MVLAAALTSLCFYFIVILFVFTVKVNKSWYVSSMKQGRQAKKYNMKWWSFICCFLKSEGWKEKQCALCGILMGCWVC